MRALVIFSLVVVAFLVVLRLYPATSVEGEEQTPAEAASLGNEMAARFLTRSPEQETPEAGSADQGITVEAPAPAVQVAPSAEVEPPSWLVAPRPLPDGAELAIASALVHGPAAEVARVVEEHPDFSAARGKLSLAFAWALAGDSSRALSLVAGIPEDAGTSREQELLQAALGGEPLAVRLREAAATASPIVLAMEMAVTERDGRWHLEAGRHAEAARAFSDLLLCEFDAPWAPDFAALSRWNEALDAAQAHHRWSPLGEWAAEEIAVESGDSPIAIRKRYLARHPDRLMCTGLILRANDVTGFLQPGQKLRVPTDRVSVLVDLGARWALYRLGDEVAAAWPVGIGRPGEETPSGDFVVRNKLENPPWMKVGQEPIPFGDPRNPLGTRWIGWSLDGQASSLGFHGTTEPESIGKALSDGCVRLRNADVEVLFEILPEGAPIHVQP